MKSKKLLLFVFIFLINTNIFVYSEDYGSISVSLELGESEGDRESILAGVKSKIQKLSSLSGLTISLVGDTGFDFIISFETDFKDFTEFFSKIFERQERNKIKTIDLSNLKIIPINLKGMFISCLGLKEIKGLSKLDTSKVVNMAEMFLYCRSLSEIDLSNFDTSLVTDMSKMFSCVNSEIINVTNFNTSLVKYMNSMFEKNINYDEELKIFFNGGGPEPKRKQEIIGLNNFDTSNVTSFNKMFSYSIGLTHLDLSSFIFSPKTNFESIFMNCINLKSLDISNFNLNSKNFVYAFYRVKLNYLNIYNVTYDSSESAFLGQDSNLQDSIANGLMVCQREQIIEGENVNQGCCLFDIGNLKCTNYLKVKYGKKTEYKNGFIKNDNGIENKYRNNIYYIFDGEKYLTFEDSFTIDTDSEIDIYFKEEQKSIEHLFDSEFDPNVESISLIDFSYLLTGKLVKTNFLFKGCSSLKSINLTFLNIISLTNIEGMFSGCKSIELFDLTEIETSLVTNMSHIFEECTSLKNIIFTNWDTSKVVDMNSMFAGCSALEEINIAHFATSTLIDMSKMFYDCIKLKTINLSTFDTKSVKYMDQLFYGCSALEILDIKNFDLINLESYEGMFSKLTSILYIDLSNLKNEKIIWESLDKKNKFYICQLRVIIENSNAFNCCEYLTNPDVCDYFPSTQLMISQTTESTQLVISQTTEIPPIITTFPKPIVRPIRQIDMILALISGWNQAGNNCRFYIHFISRTPDFNYPKTVNITVIFDYYRSLRRLEEKKGNCILEENGISSNGKYLCTVQSDNSNIKNVKILPNLEFDSTDNIILHMTPIAKMFINNIQDAKDQFNYLSDAHIYILDYCIQNRYKKNLLNISGEIQDPQPNLNINMDIVLMINFGSESDSQTEINCTITDIKVKNYSLNCRVNENIEGNFQTAISFIDDDILITYFDSYNESLIYNIKTQGGIRYNYNKKNKGINGGAIVAIVLASIACICALIGFIIVFGKKKVNQKYRENSTFNAFKLKN